MRKLLLCCCLAFSIYTVSYAQSAGSADIQAAGRKLSASLTKAQKARIKTIYAMQNKEMQQLLKTSNGNRAEMTKKMMLLMNATTVKVKAVLTPSQAVIYQKIMNQNRPRASMVSGGR